MKTLMIIFLSTMLSTAYATSFSSTHCSNSNGSVVWVSGDDENLIHLKYANFVEGTLTLDMGQVNVEFDKKISIKEKSFRACGQAADLRVYAGKVTITASETSPNVLMSQFPDNKVVSEVICTEQMRNSMPCSVNP